ncbi:MAG: hypothetical protein JWL83_3530 [Actinomycetia bacterium]|nr:hypothetical protein [Actinomycetes bacterium]
MDLRTLLKILVRRWIVVVPTIVVAAIIGHQLLSTVKPTYEAKGALLLLTPQAKKAAAVNPLNPNSAVIQPGNPYLLQAPLDKAALAFSEVMNDQRVKLGLAKQGFTKSYTVTVDQNAPILRVDTKDKRSRIAVETTKAVLEATVQQIAFRERAHTVPADQNIGTDILSSPTKATAINSAKTRALIAFIALGIAAVLSVALLVESWSQSTQNRRDRRRLTVASPSRVPVPAPAVAGGGLTRNARADPVDQTQAENEAADMDGDTSAAPASKQPGRARAKPRRRSSGAAG